MKEIKNKIYKGCVALNCQMRALPTEDGKMIVSGYAMLFNNPTVIFRLEGQDYKEVIDKNALNQCDLTDVVFDRGHLMEDKLLARTKNDTLKLEVDAKGLKFTAEIVDTQEGRDTFELIKRGDLAGCSFAATLEETAYNRETRTRTIMKFKKLYDVAAVTFPAYPGTELTAEQRSLFDLNCSGIELDLEKEKILTLCN